MVAGGAITRMEDDSGAETLDRRRKCSHTSTKAISVDVPVDGGPDAAAVDSAARRSIRNAGCMKATTRSSEKRCIVVLLWAMVTQNTHTRTITSRWHGNGVLRRRTSTGWGSGGRDFCGERAGRRPRGRDGRSLPCRHFLKPPSQHSPGREGKHGPGGHHVAVTPTRRGGLKGIVSIMAAALEARCSRTPCSTYPTHAP